MVPFKQGEHRKIFQGVCLCSCKRAHFQILLFYTFSSLKLTCPRMSLCARSFSLCTQERRGPARAKPNRDELFWGVKTARTPSKRYINEDIGLGKLKDSSMDLLYTKRNTSSEAVGKDGAMDSRMDLVIDEYNLSAEHCYKHNLPSYHSLLHLRHNKCLLPTIKHEQIP